MSDPPFDLKLLPDWLKEESFENPYANHEGEPQGRSQEGRREGRGGDRPSGERREKPRGGGARRDGESRRDAGSKRDAGPRRGQERAPAPARPAEPPAEVAIEFIADPRCLQAVIQQVQTGSRAFPLFGLARVFLEKPERHRVRITSRNAAVPLHQCGEDGPVSLDSRGPEKEAFEKLWERYYSKETIQRDPPKGNYSNVARCRLSGTLLGPTNHHSYQSALRKLYEERFQRRMSFQDYQREIEVVSDPKLVEAWKESARSSVRFTTLAEPEPLQFESAAAAEEHFRKTYLQREMRAGERFEISGPTSRELLDRRLGAAIRQEWEKERRFPVIFGQHLRREFAGAGLHIFKYHKRVLFVSAIRPVPLKNTERTSFSENVTEILRVIERKPRCARSDLAAAIFQSKPEADHPNLKAALAGDLRWLIQSGHVIEFHDGTLDLPPAPRPAVEPKPPVEAKAATAAEPEPAQTVEPGAGDPPEPVASDAPALESGAA